MALVIKNATIVYQTHPTGAALADVHYHITDEAIIDLARNGEIRVELSPTLRLQLATLAEDALLAAGKL